MDKSPDAFRTISEVAEDLDLPQHVLRFWETRFTHIKPMKRGGGRRYYRPQDVELIKGIRYMLYDQGYTIKGVQKLLKDKGPKGLLAEDAPVPAVPETPAAKLPAARGLAAFLASPAPSAAIDAAFVTSLRAIRDRLAGALAQG